MSELDFERSHVVFQTPGQTGYIESIARLTLGNVPYERLT
jgi:hypothetical protein